ncbi:60s acidic ribosomal protein-domain-containing protein [Entophlyctis helioformis]|nr:60s acidic ribosomal protein-domain-containing protein [Entophlyctis helioformis]
MSTAELACTYAALILADEGLEITADKLSALIEAAGLEVEAIWPTIFAKALAGKDVNAFLFNVGSGAGAAPAAGAPAAAGGAAPAAAAAASKKEEKKEEPKEESDDDMGFGLFD